MGTIERALSVYDTVQKSPQREQERDGLRLLIERVEPISKRGVLLGVGLDVKAWALGEELPIDGHRIFINPPTQVPDPTLPKRVATRRDGTRIERDGLRRDPAAALWDVLFDGVRGMPAPENWGVRGTVTTVFSTTADGYVISENATYATARAGSDLVAASSDPDGIGVGQQATFTVIEGFLSFDTAAISDSDTVSEVLLSVFGNFDASTTDFIIEARTSDWGAALTTADWVAGADLAALTELATFNTSGWNAAGYNEFTSNAAFLSAPNLKTGVVYVLLCSKEETDNSAPTGDEYVFFDGADVAGTTQDPKLTITHAAAVSAVGWGGPFTGWW